MEVTYVKLKDIAPVIRTNGEEEYKILKFLAYYKTAKFTGDQSDLLRHQGFDKDAFSHHYCSCWLWMVYCVEPWMERKEE